MRLLNVTILVLILALVSCEEKNNKVAQKEVRYAEAYPAERREKGWKLYVKNCESCHMKDGTGVPGLNAPLLNSEFVKGDKVKLIKVVLQGSASLGERDSKPYRNNMPGMPHLSDEEIADVLTYIRYSFILPESQVAASEVSAVRAQIK